MWYVTSWVVELTHLLVLVLLKSVRLLGSSIATLAAQVVLLLGMVIGYSLFVLLILLRI